MTRITQCTYAGWCARLLCSRVAPSCVQVCVLEGFRVASPDVVGETRDQDQSKHNL